MLWQLVKILAIAANIFLAGRAFCFFLFLPAEKDPDGPRPGTAYAAMGTGAFLTLIVSGLLRAAGAYSVPAVLGCLGLFWLAALAWPAFRAGLSLRSLGSVSVVGWLLGAAAVWLLLLPETVLELSGSSIYLTQGFDLLIDGKDPSVWPYFGELYRLPFMYAEHVVAAVFAVFSSGDHVQYYQYGEYWIDVLLA
ncbi:MAG: hypothetical protein JO254_13760, partial [Pseudolabrys sp.]|nr:hypothetical protein [Pseudolabrys sp.]